MHKHIDFDIALWEEVSKSFKKIKEVSGDEDIKLKSLDIISIRNKIDNRDLVEVLETNHEVKDFFDKETLKDIKKNIIKIDSTLDLHNYTSNNARLKFIDFIRRCYSDQLKYVLVITGKGKRGFSGDEEYQYGGILYRGFFDWVNDRAISHCIIAYSEALGIHGGGGAFYLLLRRKKK